MSTTDADVIVVGGGPAGSCAALVAARAGLRVILLERGPFPGSKNMYGGVVYPRILDQLLANWWEQAPVQRWITRRATMMLTPTQAMSVDYRSQAWGSPPHNGATALRPEWDRWLAGHAEHAGAQVVCSTTVTGLLREGGRVVGVRTDRPDGDLTAPLVVACDGVNSFLAKEAGLYEQGHAEQSEDAKLDVQHEDHDQIDRHPGRVEQRDQAGAAQGLADRRQVTERLRRILPGVSKVAFKGRIEDPRVAIEVEPSADADQNHRANPFEQRHQSEQSERDQGQHQQRRHVATAQRTIVNLQHVHRRGEHQQIDEKAECADGREGLAKRQQRLREFGALRRLNHWGSFSRTGSARCARHKALGGRNAAVSRTTTVHCWSGQQNLDHRRSLVTGPPPRPCAGCSCAARRGRPPLFAGYVR